MALFVPVPTRTQHYFLICSRWNCLKKESNCLEHVKLLSCKSFILISELKIVKAKARFHHDLCRVWNVKWGVIYGTERRSLLWWDLPFSSSRMFSAFRSLKNKMNNSFSSNIHRTNTRNGPVGLCEPQVHLCTGEGCMFMSRFNGLWNLKLN